MNGPPPHAVADEAAVDVAAEAAVVGRIQADLLLVTGPVSRHREMALRRTYDATPEPRLVVAVGDCGCDGGIFGESYASCGRVANVIPVDAVIPGCRPPPLDILRGILAVVRHRTLQPRRA